MCGFWHLASASRQPLQVLNQLSKLLESFSGALESFGHKAGRSFRLAPLVDTESQELDFQIGPHYLKHSEGIGELKTC